MISVVQLENWRAYRSFELKLYPGATFLVARNGVGKTSLIDAVRWTLNSQLPAQSDMLHGSATSGSVGVELTVGPHNVQIRRSLMKGRSKAPKSEVIAWIDGERTQNIENIYRLFEAEWSTKCGFLTRAAFITDRFLYSDEEPDLRLHLGDVFGLDNLHRAIKELGPAISESERATKAERASIAATESDLSEAESELEQAKLRLEEAISLEQTKREEADRALILVHEAEKAKTAANKLKLWHERRSQIANAAMSIVGQTSPDTDLRAVLESSERATRTQVSEERERLAVLSNQIQSIEMELERLLEAEADCPVCRRPLDDQSRDAAEHQHRSDLKAAREVAASIDLEELVVLEAQVRELLRQADDLGDAPAQHNLPSGDFTDLRVSSDAAREAHDLAIADVREAEIRHIDAMKACEGIRTSLADRTKISLLFRRHATLETARSALEATVSEVLESQLGPISEEVNRRWDALFADRSRLRLGPDGRVTRPLETQDLEFDAFSSGEKMIAKLLVRLTVLIKTTRVPFFWIDEPLEHLDPDSRRFVASTLAHLGGDDALAQIIVTTYEEPLANMLTDQVGSHVHLDYLCTAPLS